MMQWKEPHLLLIATGRDRREKPRAICALGDGEF